jgi:hypothetical protein
MGPFFRIFLSDGTTLTSYGDFARVGDRVVFSLPLGELQGQPRLHLASVPADRVDWATTERYRDATRREQYASARGEGDFAILSADVARILNEIGVASDPHVRLSLANEARAQLAAWPGEHYGYKADEIRQILSLVDEVINDLRAATGEARFDLSLVAEVAPPADVRPLPPPSLQESILQALWAARFAGSAAEKRALLEAAVGTIDVHAATLPVGWVTSTRERVVTALGRERDLDSRLANMRASVLTASERLATRADVRGVERLLQDTRKASASLAADRRDEVTALLDTLEARLDATRRLRLALDQWAVKSDALLKFERAVRRRLEDVARASSALEDIRTLAGPSLDRLDALDQRLARTTVDLRKIAVPPDGRAVHALLTSAVQLATSAVTLRRNAIGSGRMQQAWDASAAAAGSLMLLGRVRDDIARLVTPPQLP